jgi:hypothetical protein
MAGSGFVMSIDLGKTFSQMEITGLSLTSPSIVISKVFASSKK